MLKFALIGCGRISKKHTELLGTNKITNAKLSAVCDIDENKAKIIGEKYNVPYYKNMDTMMQTEDIDVVTILSESGNHAKHTVDIVNKFKKHIVCEKPMALRLEDADEMIGDSIERTVTWKGNSNLQSLSRTTVKLRFVMKDADLYSIRFKD